MRDKNHDVLFERVAIGPVTAPNRFYQVPHCNGMGRMFPNAMIRMRGMKAGTSISRIGDCYGAGPIASAVYMGHRFAKELDTNVDPDGVPFLRERHVIEA